MKKRKTYDTRVKYLVRKGLLPDLYRKQIHRSLISKWKREAPEKYTGHELNDSIAELYELMKKISEDQRLQKTLLAFYRINKTLKDIIGTGSDYIKKIREHKHQIVDAIQRAKKSIGIKRGIKLFGISKSTYRIWAMETYFRCGQSLSKLCNSTYPQQLTVNEIHKMHRILSNGKYLHWPIISVAYYGMKRSLLKAHPNTWYKYARLMKIKRKRHRKIHRKYAEGIRANAPNEKWHADITELQTADGNISYIYLVIDNYSRYITSWRVADRVCAKLRLDTFAETIEKAGIKPIKRKKNKTELIVDGGTENNNKKVETFIEKYPVKKLIALKHILKSNAMVESVNKIIKYDYLFPRHILNQSELTNLMSKVVIPDYNDKRPHGSLNGLTPLEAYGKKKVNFKRIRERMIEAHIDRVKYNRTHSCVGCPFGCKQQSAN
ncbi:MAG: DDE-type integrase/transposase/recombinase [Bacteroidetes bacterium]|nr:DDE-type integrase/transposase/recombinase [Bacteroidota bacterium]